MISYQDIEEAEETIGDYVKRTPLTQSQFLSDLCCGNVYLKLENQQITNSFKIRGACNKMLKLSKKQMMHGVVTASAGNHAQAVAIVADKLDIPATIVVPKNTPKIKIDKIKRHRVELLVYGDIYDEAEQRAMNLAEKHGLAYISPYNDESVIAGQGTVGLEILEELQDVDVVVVPVGGGGLISGMSIAVKSIKSHISIVGVQSEASPVMYESLKAGHIVRAHMKESIADGLFGGIEVGSITLGIIQTHVDDLLLVEESTIRRAICLLWKRESQIVEGAGAVPVALIIENRDMFKGKTVAAVISGGNIEKDVLRKVLAQGY